MIMARKYRLSKKISREISNEILHEMQEIAEAEQIGFTKDEDYILVKTMDDKYPSVVSRVVNICKRVGDGLEISFAGFVS